MFRTLTSRVSTTVLAFALAVGAAGCAGDRLSTSANDATPAPGLDPGSGRPFDIDRKAMADVLATTLKASGYDVDGQIIRLRFDEGSRESFKAESNCRVADMTKGRDDLVELEFPDGVLDCAEVAERVLTTGHHPRCRAPPSIGRSGREPSGRGDARLVTGSVR